MVVASTWDTIVNVSTVVFGTTTTLLAFLQLRQGRFRSGPTAIRDIPMSILRQGGSGLALGVHRSMAIPPAPEPLTTALDQLVTKLELQLWGETERLKELRVKLCHDRATVEAERFIEAGLLQPGDVATEASYIARRLLDLLDVAPATDLSSSVSKFIEVRKLYHEAEMMRERLIYVQALLKSEQVDRLVLPIQVVAAKKKLIESQSANDGPWDSPAGDTRRPEDDSPGRVVEHGPQPPGRALRGPIAQTESTTNIRTGSVARTTVRSRIHNIVDAVQWTSWGRIPPRPLGFGVGNLDEFTIGRSEIESSRGVLQVGLTRFEPITRRSRSYTPWLIVSAVGFVVSVVVNLL
jgi:hypothetical protein